MACCPSPMKPSLMRPDDLRLCPALPQLRDGIIITPATPAVDDPIKCLLEIVFLFLFIEINFILKIKYKRE